MSNNRSARSLPASAADDPRARCSVAEAARRLGVSRREVERRVRAGALDSVREGDRLLVLLPAEPLAEHAVGAGPPPAEPYATVQLDPGAANLPAQPKPAALTEPHALHAGPPEPAPTPDTPQPEAAAAPTGPPEPAAPLDAAGIAAADAASPYATVQFDAVAGQLAHGQPAPARPAAPPGAPGDASRWWIWLGQILIALLIGLAILLLADYLIDGDAIPLLPDRAAVASLPPQLAPTAPAPAMPSIRAARPSPVLAVLARPTARPRPSATPRPTARPAATPAPRPAPAELPPADVLVRRIAAATAALRTGSFDATIDYGAGAQPLGRLAFDRGDARRPARLRARRSYTNSRGETIVERITIGDASWQRRADGSWQTAPVDAGLPGELDPLLPLIDPAAEVSVAAAPGGALLRWYDPVHRADVELLADPASGVPRELRRVTRRGGAMLVVTYRRWNTPVEIQPPAAI